MAGHSHWAGIKHKKEIADKKRGENFSKLLAAVTAAAKKDPNPNFNPRLRTQILKAHAKNVPTASIERAIARAGEAGGSIEALLFEAYGTGGVALLIEAATDSKNRTVAEVKRILGNFEGKLAEPGSVRWAFEETAGGTWNAKFPILISPEVRQKLEVLLEALREHPDVQEVFTNATLSDEL